MKLTYITGASSTGKTTLANKISGNATILSLDALSKSVRFVFDDFKLYTAEISVKPTINNDKFLSLVAKYVECFMNDYPDKDLIIEGCHFTPDEFLSVFPQAKIIALGIMDKKTALAQINKRDWMSKLDECIKNEYADKIVEYSLQLKEEQNKYKYIEYTELSNND